MKVLKSLNSLNVEGSDAYTFIDSLVSNSINENEYKFSYLLGPDGKVNFWFIFSDLLLTTVYETPNSFFILSRKRLFFLLESTKTILMGIFSASAIMLNTTPGKPAPEPTSKRFKAFPPLLR